MPGDVGLLAALLSDPLAAYPALAALLLASVSLATGLLRGDALALARPVPVTWLLVAVAATWGAALATAAAVGPWDDVLAGLARLPLYLFALAYGAAPALVAAALVAAWAPLQHAGPWGPWLLGLEVLVIGWLAVWPSPRRSRWSGPLYAPLAYALAWGTAGIAALALERGVVDAAAVAAQHGLVPAGVIAAALLLALLSPAAYARAFPDSRIVPAGHEDRRDRPPEAASREARRSTLVAPPVAPAPFTRSRAPRAPLTPVPDDAD